MNICKVDGCDNTQDSLGYCQRHYRNFKKYSEITCHPTISCRDSNEIIIEQNHAKVILRDVLGKISGIVLVDIDKVPIVKQYKWHINAQGYAVSESKGEYVRMHHIITGISLDDISKYNISIDHINMNPLDNRISNIRRCTYSENQINIGKRIFENGTSSRFKGVYWHKHGGKWNAYININKKRHSLGLFKNEFDAGRAYDRAAIDAYGEFARTNEQLGLFEGVV